MMSLPASLPSWIGLFGSNVSQGTTVLRGSPGIAPGMFVRSRFCSVPPRPIRNDSVEGELASVDGVVDVGEVRGGFKHFFDCGDGVLA